jgi:hypothetical protein
MPSPFPGMDPFIEMEEWQDFHVTIIVAMKEQLVRQVTPKYTVAAERRVYLEHAFDETQESVPDIRISAARPGPKPQPAKPGGVAIAPRLYTVPIPREQKEPYLVIRDRAGNEIITVIEFLSPFNKRPGSDGYRAYQEKRDETLRSAANLVEIDLLRKGHRPATTRPLLETTDYCAMVHRRAQRPAVEVYEWQLRDPLPPIPIPLDRGDPDAVLDLQQALTFAYDLSAYEYQLPYSKPLKPAVRKGDAKWLKGIVSSIGK